MAAGHIVAGRRDAVPEEASAVDRAVLVGLVGGKVVAAALAVADFAVCS